MSGAVRITRHQLSAAVHRKHAKKEKNPLIVGWIFTIAWALDGADRKSPARSCCMDRQTIWEWVHRYNAEGLEGLAERRHNIRKSSLTPDVQKRFFGTRRTGPRSWYTWGRSLAPS
jgi:Winged helix-turn helix